MNLASVALVGLGSVGRRHLRLLRELRPDLSIVLVRSGHGEESPEESLATRTVGTVDDAITAGVQAAIISTPAHLHLHQSMRFIEAGVSILVEKPLSRSSEGIEKLIDLASSHSGKYLVGYVLRYDPSAQCFKKWLQNPTIGKVIHANITCGSFLPEWRPRQDYRKSVSALPELGGGVLLELSHELDYLHWFFGRPLEVQAKLSKSGVLGIDVEDSADMLLSYPDDVTLTVHLDFNRRISVRVCIVQTSQGELHWDVLERKVVWHSPGNTPVIEQFEYDRDYMYRSQLEHFLMCMEQNVSPNVTLADGAAVLNLIEAARQANKSGCKVVLP